MNRHRHSSSSLVRCALRPLSSFRTFFFLDLCNSVVDPRLLVSSSHSCASNSDKHTANVLLPHKTARLLTLLRSLTAKPHSNLLHNAG
ncbi:hypothetical protein K443DRAFT_494589 [Laccaria amethystina LaAM-08-1]|uniref:Uncharacterized protein n=1 Tax=Laccaria amethystina LaAM-08-1 TaxID=1095629 RepID=A0A0C9Y4G8_9AGAR|nr:hypothetical protein K443DRAFT_494589 [Laccaria amethystina LaAM-08-1]